MSTNRLQSNSRRRAFGLSRLASLALLPTLLLVACGGSSSSATLNQAKELRLGYLPNITHAPALVGINHGFFKDALGSSVELRTQSFNAGPAEVEALLGNSLDAGFFGPGPAITAFNRTHGKGIRIISGVASGGAALVVRTGAGITTVADLKGRKVSTPQLGNTQDVALRAYLKKNGLKTDLTGGGDVHITPTDNANTLLLMKQGQVDAAWVPEPWVSRLVAEAGGTVLLDEATLWPDGKFPTTNLIVSTTFLDKNPKIVSNLLSGLVKALDFIASDPAQAKEVVNQAFVDVGGKKLAPAVMDAAWARLAFTVDPLPGALKKDAQDAIDAGTLSDAKVEGIYDLRLLNEVLVAAGKPKFGTGGLGPS